MASLGEMYTRALTEGLGYQRGWMPNWPPSFPVELGRVCEITHDRDTGIIALDGNNKLTDYGITSRQSDIGVLAGRARSCGGRKRA